MSTWNQIVLAIGYAVLAEAAIFVPACLVSLWRDNRALRRQQQEVNELERMYEG